MQHNDDYRQEFAKLLREVRIPAGCPNKMKHESFQRLNGYIKAKMPASLYRYRPTEPHNMKGLRENSIPVSKPIKMQDKLDSLITVDIKRVVAEIKKMEGSTDAIANQLYEGKPIPEFAFRSVSPRIRRVVEGNQDLLKGNIALRPVMKIMAASIGGTLRKRAESELKRTIEVLRNTGYIACFCEDKDRMRMWEEYAAKHTGYVLEYDFEALNARFHTVDVNNKSLQPDYIVLPVIYGEEYDSTEIIMHSLLNRFVYDKGGKGAHINHPDVLWQIKGFMYKAAEYEAEAEWRLITPLNGVSPDTNPYSFVGAAPRAIYYGADMPDKTRQELDIIAQDKGLTRYRMNRNTKDNTVVAEPV